MNKFDNYSYLNAKFRSSFIDIPEECTLKIYVEDLGLTVWASYYIIDNQYHLSYNEMIINTDGAGNSNKFFRDIENKEIRKFLIRYCDNIVSDVNEIKKATT